MMKKRATPTKQPRQKDAHGTMPARARTDRQHREMMSGRTHRHTQPC